MTTQPLILTRLDVLRHRLTLYREKFREAARAGKAFDMQQAVNQFEATREQLQKAGVTVSEPIHKESAR